MNSHCGSPIYNFKKYILDPKDISRSSSRASKESRSSSRMSSKTESSQASDNVIVDSNEKNAKTEDLKPLKTARSSTSMKPRKSSSSDTKSEKSQKSRNESKKCKTQTPFSIYLITNRSSFTESVIFGISEIISGIGQINN